jgi:hypothetical protein
LIDKVGVVSDFPVVRRSRRTCVPRIGGKVGSQNIRRKKKNVCRIVVEHSNSIVSLSEEQKQKGESEKKERKNKYSFLFLLCLRTILLN